MVVTAFVIIVALVVVVVCVVVVVGFDVVVAVVLTRPVFSQVDNQGDSPVRGIHFHRRLHDRVLRQNYR